MLIANTHKSILDTFCLDTIYKIQLYNNRTINKVFANIFVSKKYALGFLLTPVIFFIDQKNN